MFCQVIAARHSPAAFAGGGGDSSPEMWLILDEPTSGVDPVARDMFWQLMVDLAPGQSDYLHLHPLYERSGTLRPYLTDARRKVLANGTPQELVEKRGSASLEEAFIAYLREAAGAEQRSRSAARDTRHHPRAASGDLACVVCLATAAAEALELRRDPVRSTLALMGTVILMLIMGYGISMDVENLRFAVLDRDQTVSSRAWTLNLSGSRYFIEQPPLTSYDELDRRMRAAISRWRLRFLPISGAISRVVRLWNSVSGSTVRCPVVPKR